MTGLILLAGIMIGGFSIDDNGKTVTVKEDTRPVFTFHREMVTPPEKVSTKFVRSCYIHPLCGLDGEVLTEDFPADHYHHRGVFWAWPHSTVDGKDIDVWTLEGARQRFDKILSTTATDKEAVLSFQDHWAFDESPDKAELIETVTFTVHPADAKAQDIDVVIRLENVSGREFILRGSKTANKGYGGLCFRPDSSRKPMHFTTAVGPTDEDVLNLRTPWADASFATEKDGKKLSGLAIFQHKSLPGYPHPGWILRNYGFLGQSWPHTEPYPMKPGDSCTLRYRMVVHRGDAQQADLADRFAAYEKSAATP